ncbi:hypothetical protein OCU04_011129 [Sclerotinia nivalis]|uniref:Uncharacterized protein n=1 Tax=Sclerotinia nivalis TaxID=352851 RepID=A0A9X0AC46_9HELO|nr:hypothetical protein OCU04_011129 [Sclerotinia nivalis]
MLKAISLIGQGLKTRYDNREAREWAFERENVVHISLCLDVYLPECEEELTSGQVIHDLAKVLGNFAGFRYYWAEYDSLQHFHERSIKTYETTLSAVQDPELEEKLHRQKRELSIFFSTVAS